MKIYMENLPRLLFPPRCPFCDKVLFHSVFAPAEKACGACRGKPEYVKEPMCKRCGKPIADERQEYCRAKKSGRTRRGKRCGCTRGP